MKTKLKPISILMADDDPDDRMLMKQALAENELPNTIEFVENGADLLDYLYKTGKFHLENTIRPGLILLDLNMPKMDGREALRLIKSSPDLRRIPVIVLTTSKAEEDVIQTYDLGVNSYLTKPGLFTDFVKSMKSLYGWLRLCHFPHLC